MCGIVGFWGGEHIGDSSTIDVMASRLAHRGPDDLGTWSDNTTPFHCGHSRLAILDLSSAGAQPFVFESGRYALVYNGEIYNHLELRSHDKLKHWRWRGTSDTETLAGLLSSLGVEKTLPMLDGMFAFALWDSKEKELILARDPFGEKPLYWGIVSNILFFSSELKALDSHPKFEKRICDRAERSYLNFGFVSTDESIFAGISRVTPGSFIRVTSDTRRGWTCSSTSYWSLRSIVNERDPIMISDEEWSREVATLFESSVRLRLLSDVPVGAFLSGGLDSANVAKVISDVRQSKILTLTLGSQNKRYDESTAGAEIASALGLDHQNIMVNSSDAVNIVPKLSEVYCEPFSDSSQIPTILISKLAREHVKVVLTGDGGDELFGGYNRHKFGPTIYNSQMAAPLASRISIGKFLNFIAPKVDKLKFLDAYLPLLGLKISKVAGGMSCNTVESFYEQLLRLSPNSTAELFMRHADGVPEGGRINSGSIQLLDIENYLVHDILTKVDRASMASSLESRAPFLSKELFEFVFTTRPKSENLRGPGKHFLKASLKERLPDHLINAPKRGFGVPIEDWLRGPLKKWAEWLLFDSSLSHDYYTEMQLTNEWSNFQSGRSVNHHFLWSVLMYRQWRESNKI